VGGGDGFYAQVDPTNPDIIYRNLQMGRIERLNQKNDQGLSIIPRASLDEEPYRFNWSSPIYISPHDPKVLYFGGNFLFKSTNKGDSWEKISPDLSSNDPQKIVDSGGPISPDNTGAEVHCTIYTIAEPPVKQGIIWAGTDDGNLWVTRDNGENWDNVIKNIKGLPSNSWVSRVEASHFSKSTVYVTFDRHRSDDYAPYVFKSENLGKTWTSLRNNLPKTGYLHVIREDPVSRSLLYLGSEFGLFFSFDGGKHWLPFKKDFPTTAVRDIAVHPRDKDLIVGTHGRGVWIWDDISSLQQLSHEVLNNAVHLFDILPATIYYERKDAELYSDPVFSVPNPPFGAAVNYYLQAGAPKDQPVRIHIYDPEGKKVRTLKGTGKKGLNRIYWDLHDKPVFKKLPAIFKGDLARWFGTPKGPFVLPGTYKVVLEYGKQKLEKQVEVRKDKNLAFPLDEWKENREIVMQLSELMRKGFAMVYGIRQLDGQLQKLAKDLNPGKDQKKKIPPVVMDKFKDVNKKLDKLKTVFSASGFKGIFRVPIKVALKGGSLPEQIFMMQMNINNYPGKPTETQKARLKEILQKVLPLFREAGVLINSDIPELNRLLRENNFDFIKAPKL